MKTTNFFFATLLAIFPLLSKAEWISLDKSKSQQTLPKVSLISNDNNSTVLKIDISGFDLKELNSNGKSFKTLDLLTDIFTNEVGNPEVSHIAKVLAIPNNASISYEVIETGEMYTFNNILLPPVRESWYEGAVETDYQMNSRSYDSEQIYPQNIVNIETPSIFRDFRITRVSIYPVRYIAAKQEIQVTSSITVRIKYGNGEVINPKLSQKKL